MKSFSTGGIDAWPSDSYLNVWVCPLQGTLQGFATPPGGDPLFDGIVVAPQYFGSKAYDLFGNFYLGNNFDLGRTATHEVGHWLNLRHIWGDGDCAVDDFVNDTPPSDGPNFGCTLNTESCSSTDMVQNFMDYTYDGCMSLFTTGQKNRAHALFAPGGAREDILLSVGCGYQNAYCQDIINEVYVDNYASTVYQIAAGDVDGDLVDDIFVVANTVLSAPFIGSYDNTILYRHEKIDGNYSSKIEIATISTFLRLGISKMFLVDMETDGDLDIVLIAPEGSIMWVENLGENQFSAVKQVLTSNKSSNHRFSDIDGDGHLDLVASFVKRINPVYPSSLDTSIISYYKNDGLGNFSEHTRLFQKLNADAKKIELADINQDGYIDIITSEEQSKDLSYYVNLGNETFNYEIQFKSKNSLDDFILDNEKIAFDIDADGDEDILSISINRQIHLLKNNGTGDFTTNVISNSNKVNYFKPDFINNDQFPDICYVQDNDEVFYLINNGDGNFTEQKVVTLSSESNPYPSLALGFFDDDNIKDVVLSKNYFGNISYFSSSITESFTSTAVKSVDPIGVGPENETPNNTILQYTIQF